MDVQDDVEEALVEVLKEDSGQHNSFTDADLCVFFQAVVVPDTFVCQRCCLPL